MTTQNIDFNNVESVTFNGDEVTTIKLNGSTIFQAPGPHECPNAPEVRVYQSPGGDLAYDDYDLDRQLRDASRHIAHDDNLIVASDEFYNNYSSDDWDAPFITWDFCTPVTLTGYTIKSLFSYSNDRYTYIPMTGEIKASDDGVNWETLDERQHFNVQGGSMTYNSSLGETSKGDQMFTKTGGNFHTARYFCLWIKTWSGGDGLICNQAVLHTSADPVISPSLLTNVRGRDHNPSASTDGNYYFGTRTAVAGDFMMVSATPYPSVADKGEVFVYKRGSVSESWSYTGQKITMESLGISDTSGYGPFGYDIAMYEDWAVIALKGQGLEEKGTAVVYKRSSSSDQYEHVVNLTPGVTGASSDQFKTCDAVAMYGDYVAYGSKDDVGSSNLSGAVFVYHKDESTNPVTWSKVATLTPEDPPFHFSQMMEDFGNKMHMHDGYLAVGADGDDEGGQDASFKYATDAGACYIFRLSTGHQWERIQKIIPSEGWKHQSFGGVVKLRGSYLAVSSPQYDPTIPEGNYGQPTYPPGSNKRGAVSIYKRNSSGHFTLQQMIVPQPEDLDLSVADLGSGYFGGSLSFFDDNTLLIGAPNAVNGTGNRMGLVCIYKLDSDNQWKFDKQSTLKLYNGNDPDGRLRFGGAISSDGQSHAFISANRYNNYEGRLFVYNMFS